MSDLVLDAGHGGKDPGAVGANGLQEKECTLYIAQKCGEILKEQGIIVKQTRTDDSYIGLSERAQIANDDGAKYFISIHINNADIKSAMGMEVYALAQGGESENLASVELKYLIDETKLSNRGVKFANFAVLRETNMPAVMVEIGFISNSNEEQLLRNDGFKDRVALALAKGYLDYIGKPYQQKGTIILEAMSKTSTPIVEAATALKDQAKQWAKNNGATPNFIALADLYWELYSDYGGVNPVAAYAQSALETGFGKFHGVIDETYKNPCKLKNIKAVDNEPTFYTKFDTWKAGVSAHFDHLALYAGVEGYPRNNTKDPRHFPYLFGTVKYVEELSGKWVPAQDYGFTIIKLMLEISNTVIVGAFAEEVLDNALLKTSNNSDVSKKNNDIIIIKDKINSNNADLEKIKKQYDEINLVLGKVESRINEIEQENNSLKEEKDNLKQDLKRYQDIVEGILNILNTVRK